MRKYSKIFLYNISLVILLLVLIEVAIRIFSSEIQLTGTSKNIFVDSLYSTTRGLKENSFCISNGVSKSTNQFHSWKYKRTPSRKNKNLFLGDSVTMGIGVENDSTFGGILNNYFDVINPSLLGYSSFEYINVFNSFVLENRYNLEFNAVYIFWTLNDVYPKTIIQEQPSYKKDNLLYNVINYLRENSKTYLFLKNTFTDRSEVYFYFDSKFYYKDSPDLIRSLDDILYISEKCREMKLDFCVFLLPYEYQIRNFGNNDIVKLQEIFSEILTDNEIKNINCIEAFKDDNTNSRKYFLYGDGIHFSESGHKKLADYLLKKINY
ncbi:MAG TPA: hypothetical protein VLN45_08340 [Ignavibacteriaceae bacterium]|nr:hypothetical protein [Ignavibacteriaceae bacterium]